MDQDLEQTLLQSRDAIVDLVRKTQDPRVLFGGYNGGGDGAINILAHLPQDEQSVTMAMLLGILGDQLDLLQLRDAMLRVRRYW